MKQKRIVVCTKANSRQKKYSFFTFHNPQKAVKFLEATKGGVSNRKGN